MVAAVFAVRAGLKDAKAHGARLPADDLLPNFRAAYVDRRRLEGNRQGFRPCIRSGRNLPVHRVSVVLSCAVADRGVRALNCSIRVNPRSRQADREPNTNTAGSLAKRSRSRIGLVNLPISD